MQVVLLERVAKLGQMGEVVNVKDGYARNSSCRREGAARHRSEPRVLQDRRCSSKRATSS